MSQIWLIFLLYGWLFLLLFMTFEHSLEHFYGSFDGEFEVALRFGIVDLNYAAFGVKLDLKFFGATAVHRLA